MIQTLTDGSMVFTGTDTDRFRLLVLKGALRLEVAGMSVSRGRTAYARVKDEFGFKGSKKSVFQQFEAHLRQIGVLATEPIRLPQLPKEVRQ